MVRQPTFSRCEDALWHRTSRRTLVNPPAGATFELRGIAALVWEALAGAVTAADVAGDLAAVFDQPVISIREEVETLLAELVAAGAVRSA